MTHFLQAPLLSTQSGCSLRISPSTHCSVRWTIESVLSLQIGQIVTFSTSTLPQFLCIDLRVIWYQWFRAATLIAMLRQPLAQHIANQLFGVCQINCTLVERAADNRAADTRISEFAELFDIVEVGHTARSDYRNVDGVCQRRSCLNIYPLHHPVTGNIGVDDGADAVTFETLGKLGSVDARALGPTLDCDIAVTRIETDYYLLRKAFA